MSVARLLARGTSTTTTTTTVKLVIWKIGYNLIGASEINEFAVANGIPGPRNDQYQANHPSFTGWRGVGGDGYPCVCVTVIL